MHIAEKIYLKVQQLPEELAQEVLAYIGYLEVKNHLALHPVEQRPRSTNQREDNNRVRENPDDPVWQDLLF
jgi:hypothetical protein